MNIDKLVHGDEYDPHLILGLHPCANKESVIRLWRPGAQTVYLEVFGKIVEATRMSDAGMFEYVVPAKTTYKDYRIYHNSGLLAHDPYAFWPTLGDLDLHLFAKGVHYQIHKVMGGRLLNHQGCQGGEVRRMGTRRSPRVAAGRTSTIGMGALTRCAAWGNPAFGRYSSPASAKGRSISLK